MKSILVANPKGGAGKSTLATNLAGYFAGRGARVMLGDTDRQQSSRDWLALRSPLLSPVAGWEMEAPADKGTDARLRPAKPPAGTTHAILDTPAGLHGKQLDRLLKLVRRVIVPVQPSLFDILATRSFLEKLLAEKAVRKQQTFVAVVGMRVDARTRAAAELERFLAQYELPVLAYLRDTQRYVQLAAHGMTLFDLTPARVEQDLAQWQPIVAWADAG
jgi:chromosome partitioning protein